MPTIIEIARAYILRGEAYSALQEHFTEGGFKNYTDGQKCMNRIKAIPAADVVEVVRCLDCMLARKPDRRKPAENRACEGTLICCVGFDHVYPDTDDGLIFIDENFYCAEGKRKDGGRDDV